MPAAGIIVVMGVTMIVNMTVIVMAAVAVAATVVTTTRPARGVSTTFPAGGMNLGDTEDAFVPGHLPG
jgi:hypothetical protein